MRALVGEGTGRCKKGYVNCPKPCWEADCHESCAVAGECCTSLCVLPEAREGIFDEAGRIKPEVLDEVNSYLAGEGELTSSAARALTKAMSRAYDRRREGGAGGREGDGRGR
jgi:hypothetical protein